MQDHVAFLIECPVVFSSYKSFIMKCFLRTPYTTAISNPNKDSQQKPKPSRVRLYGLRRPTPQSQFTNRG